MKKLIVVLLVIIACLLAINLFKNDSADTNAYTEAPTVTAPGAVTAPSPTTAPTTTVPATAAPTTAAPVAATTAAPTETVLHLNETVTIGNYELTITDVRIVEKFTVFSTPNSRMFSGGKDECMIAMLYTLRNIGKTEINTGEYGFELVYSDGYIFNSDLYYHSRTYQDIYAHGGTQESIVPLEVLGKEVYFLESFTVPKTVRDNTSEDLKIRVKGSYFGVDGLNMVYNIRNIDDSQKESLYQQALTLKNEGSFKLAMNKLSEVGDYKDAKSIYAECEKNWAVRYGISDDAGDYLRAHINEFSVVSGSELSSMMTGTWKLSKGSTAWQFLSDGTINDGWGNSRWWSVSGNNLILQTDSIVDTLTVKKVCDNGYLLVDSTGGLYSTMYTP